MIYHTCVPTGALPGSLERDEFQSKWKVIHSARRLVEVSLKSSCSLDVQSYTMQTAAQHLRMP